MDDLISRKAAIEAHYEYCNKHPDVGFPVWSLKILKDLPSAQPEERTEERTETHACDCIERQAAIDALISHITPRNNGDGSVTIGVLSKSSIKDILDGLPSAQPTLYGYNIEHLEMIARVLQKENLPPERVVEMLTDIGRIVAIICDEFEDNLRKAVEQCMT